MTYYIGQGADSGVLGDQKRYLYALYRDDVGDLYYWKIDNLTNDGSYFVNNPGLAQNDFEDFEYGVDFFDGRLADDHSRPYPNLAFDQYRWDNRNIYYYINESGDFCAKINQAHVYPADQIISE